MTYLTYRNRLFANLALGLSLAAGLAASAPTASAQSTTRMKATIPFDFTANKKPLPAGDYVLEINRDGVLAFSNLNTGRTLVVLVRSNSYTDNKGGSRLVFHREAGLTYLAQVWSAGTSSHSELLSHPKPQHELAKLAPPASTFEIAMR